MKKRATRAHLPGLSVVIITKNAAETIADTLLSVAFADEIIVIDDESDDGTIDIALKHTGHVISAAGSTFAQKRDRGLAEARGDWILYIDSDEVVTEDLKLEILNITKHASEGSYSLARENYFLGRKMYPDTVERLFYKEDLRGWTGEIHESALTIGNHYRLQKPLLHYTHRTITSMLFKTNEWSEIEAGLRIKANHPPVVWWRLVRIAVTVGWQQFGKLKLGRFGREGLFEGVFQIIDKLIVYTKLWERQHSSR